MAERENFIGQIEVNSGHIDSNIAAFSKAVLQSGKVEVLTDHVLRLRGELPPLHFGLLTYAAYQYALLKHLTGARIGELSWEDAVEIIERDFFDTVVGTVLQENVSITNPRRYGALGMAMLHLMGKEKVRMVDVGCGFYPDGVARLIDDPVGWLPEPVDEETRELRQLVCGGGLGIGEVVALDEREPDPEWTAACIWQPLKELPVTYDGLIQRLSGVNRSVRFVKADIASEAISGGNLGKFGVAFMANVLYQIPGFARQRLMENVAGLLQPSGWLLSAEYLREGSRRRPFTYAISGFVKSETEFMEKGPLFYLDCADCLQIRAAG